MYLTCRNLNRKNWVWTSEAFTAGARHFSQLKSVFGLKRHNFDFLNAEISRMLRYNGHNCPVNISFSALKFIYTFLFSMYSGATEKKSVALHCVYTCTCTTTC